jgi:Zn-dependent peptidase ImmA (M78 family)
MKPTEYYEEMKAHARIIRSKHGLTNLRVKKSDIGRIYKAYNIQYDLWPVKDAFPTAKLKKLRGAFFNDEHGPAIMISRSLPEAPAIFTMCHEFKHYLVDREIPYLWCGDYNQKEEIEIGAEVFAAEMLFPDELFTDHLIQMGVKQGQCTPENLVRLKRETQATISYAGLVKKAEFLGFAVPGSFSKVKFEKLEEEIYGVPAYKQFRRPKK